jgi:hypothetical protein
MTRFIFLNRPKNQGLGLYKPYTVILFILGYIRILLLLFGEISASINPKNHTAFMNPKKNLIILAALLSLLNNSANANEVSPASGFLPYFPGFSVSGTTGSITQINLASITPVWGRPNSFIYFSPQALYYDTDQYSGSLGIGYRKLINDSVIVGAFLFNDYDRAPSGHVFSFLSPGIELITNRWGFSANLYLPVGQKDHNTEQYFAADFGHYDDVSFSGHNQIDQLVNTAETTGLGADTELSYRLPLFNQDIQLAVDGYYFNPQGSTPITGAAARISIPLNKRLELSMSDGYDNVFHNTVKISLTLDLGSRQTHFHSNANLQERMTDAVTRNLVAESGGAHTNQPIIQIQQYTGQYTVSTSNIWFFTPDGASQNCTAENPCSWNQNNITDVNQISPHANLYVASGNYASSGQLLIYNGQSIFGRSIDFTAPVYGENRPQLSGSFSLQGDNTLQDLILHNDGVNNTAITLYDHAAVTLSDLQIGGENGYSYTTGISLGNYDQLHVQNSTVLVENNSRPFFNNAVTGLQINGNYNQITIDQSQIHASTQGAENIATGISIEGQYNKFKINQSQISANTNGPDGIAFGIDVENSNNVFSDIQYSKISANVNGSNDLAGGLVVGFSNTADNNHFNDISDTQILADSSGNNSASASIAILNGNNNFFNLDNSQLTGSTQGFSSTGIISHGDNNTINIANSTITAQVNGEENGAQATGISIDGGSSNTYNIKNSEISGSVSGDGQIATALSVVGDFNTVNIDHSQLSAIAEGIGSAAKGIQTFSSTQNIFNINSSVIAADAHGDNSPAFGISDFFTSGNIFKISNSRISALANGVNTYAMGVDVEAVSGAKNQFTFTSDQINAIANGVNSDAFGIASGQFIATTENVFTLDTTTQINAYATAGNAYGLWDYGLGTNAWNINPNTIGSQISVSAGPGKTRCPTFNILNPGCRE